jgi:L-fucose isomerase-like protein
LSEVLAATAKVDIKSARARRTLERLKAYGNVPAGIADLDAKFERHLRLFLAVQDWMDANAIDAAGFQCWTSLQQNYGCAACLTMSMMSEGLRPLACEVDVAGVTAMYALVLASGSPAAIVDWNNNYGDDLDKCVLFHCSNWPKDILTDIPVMRHNDILANTLGEARTFGPLHGRAKPEPFTYLRVETDDVNGCIAAYAGEGRFTDDPLDSFGGLGVVEVPRLQELLQFICDEGFEHHVAVNLSLVADAVVDAFDTYLGWDVYYHQ